MNHYTAIINELKIRGHRITELRKAIIKELVDSLKPVSVTEILESLGKKGLNPHKTSVYREITFLMDNRFINRVTFGDKHDRFELAALGHHHHAVCANCGQVEDVVCCDGIKEIEQMLEGQNFKVHHHLVEFIGLCKNCQ
jgi:Fur family ferric uptake transcriptional regulator